MYVPAAPSATTNVARIMSPIVIVVELSFVVVGSRSGVRGVALFERILADHSSEGKMVVDEL